MEGNITLPPESGGSQGAASICLPSRGEAMRHVAGLPHIVRVAKALEQRGFRSLFVTLADGLPLTERCRAEFRRVAPEIEVREALPPSGIPAVSQSLIDATASSWRIVRATGKDSDGLVSRWINRPISQAMTWLVLHVPTARPLHATIAAALIGLAMAASLFAGDARGVVWGAILYQAASVVDGIDGEIARATFRSSPFGATIDTCVDALTNILFFAGLTFNLTHQGNPQVALFGASAVAAFFGGLILLSFFNKMNNGSLNFEFLKIYYKSRYHGRYASIFSQSLSYMISRDFYAFFFMVMILAGFAEWVIYTFSFFAVIWLAALAGAAPGAMRQLRTPEPGQRVDSSP